jgi:hypothetical protein
MYHELEQLLAGVAVAPGGKLTVTRGDTVRMTVAFDYRGPAINVTLRCSIGKRTLGVFDEIAYATKSLSLSQSADFVSYTAFADISTSPIEPEANLDIEAKISEYAGKTLVKIDNVIDVLGAAEFDNFRITDYSKV